MLYIISDVQKLYIATHSYKTIVHDYAKVYMNASHTCVSIYTYIYVYIYIYTHDYPAISMYVSAHMYIHMCLFEHVHRHVMYIISTFILSTHDLYVFLNRSPLSCFSRKIRTLED